MGFVLDTILKKIVVEGPETISPDYTSDVIEIGNREDEFSIQLDYNNGSTVNMTLSLEVSTDGITFVPRTDSEQVITDNSGTHIWDIGSTGTNYIRVSITGSGSIDIQKILYTAKRRH